MEASTGALMDRRLLEAATSGDSMKMKDMALHDPSLLLGTTQQGNTCLLIACIHGHEGFCRDAVALNRSLLCAANADRQTPLLLAVTSGHGSLASFFLRCCLDLQLSETILKVDRHRCNALHHAIRGGHREVSLELVAAEPALSRAVNVYNESPLAIAVMRDYADVSEKLLGIPDSAHSAFLASNALHAAVRNGNPDIAKMIMEARPSLAREEDADQVTPVRLAALEGKVDVLRVLLERDGSLGYQFTTNGIPLLCSAASGGHIGVAQELLKHCPDAPYCDTAIGRTCLHLAVSFGRIDFVEFARGSKQLRKLINMPDKSGQTALHLAVRSGNSKIVAALLRYQDVDVSSVLHNPAMKSPDAPDEEYKTINWMISCKASCCSSRRASIDRRLAEAAISGDAALLEELGRSESDPGGVLLATNPQGNTCLHISSIHGHEGFCKDALELVPSLATVANVDGETPLLTAVTSGNVSLASVLLRHCSDGQLSSGVLNRDKHGCNALHHAIRCGHRQLALEMLEVEPTLSSAVNDNGESPMFMAVMRDFTDVFDKLLGISESAHGGACGYNALHAAVRNGNKVIAERIMETRPWLAREEDMYQLTPVHSAALEDKAQVLKVLLEQDPSLGYLISTNGTPVVCCAAYWGYVAPAQELLKHCPDAPYCVITSGWTCLHVAVDNGHREFVQFVLGTHLKKLVHVLDKSGETALHLAVRKCNPKIVADLLHHGGSDVTVLNRSGQTPSWVLSDDPKYGKTLNWNQVSKLLQDADPKYKTSVYNLHARIKDKLKDESKKDIKALTQTYISNTSVVAILITTITFAAAFTLPGGYSSDAEDKGLPIMARKAAFVSFLVSDTLAMCSSLAVAFLCIKARWEDLEFLQYYVKLTRKLMWFAYMATTIAFATGLYTVLAPRVVWLAISVCAVSVLLPILTKLVGEWPIWKLQCQFGTTFKSDILDMV